MEFYPANQGPLSLLFPLSCSLAGDPLASRTAVWGSEGLFGDYIKVMFPGMLQMNGSCELESGGNMGITPILTRSYGIFWLH